MRTPRNLTSFKNDHFSRLPPDHPPSVWDQSAVFSSLELHGSSPESGDLWYKSRQLKKTIWSVDALLVDLDVSRLRDLGGTCLQGYLAYKKTHPTPRPSYGPRPRPSVESWGDAFSYERGTHVRFAAIIHTGRF